MNKENLIKDSIKKWELIVAGKGVDKGGENCALCNEYDDCAGCPVALYTNHEQCIGTPYGGYRSHFECMHSTSSYNNKVICTKCIELAQKMVDFLKEVLGWYLVLEKKKC